MVITSKRLCQLLNRDKIDNLDSISVIRRFETEIYVLFSLFFQLSKA